jgi:uncharacterized protein (DUF1501 family)
MINRRAFMRSGAMAVFAAGMGGVPSFITATAGERKIIHPYKKTKTLVCIFQRGAMDGLMAVSPYIDPNLKALRPGLFMSPTASEGSLTDLDGKFGLHPSLSSLYPFFLEGRMAMVHGVGSPNTTRSHFDAQDYMESGTPFTKNTPSGWLNRAVGLTGHDATPFSAVSLTNALPRSFYGPQDVLAISNLEEFALQMKGNPQASKMTAKSFEQLYDQTSNDLLKQSGKESFEAMKMLDLQLIKNYKAVQGVVYPNSALGKSLKQVAMLIKMNVGLEVAFAESGGWDTHFAQGTTNGLFARNLKDFSESIAAFWKDMEAYQDDVTVMTMTEFGRTVHQNGTGGTDHGRASCLFVLGNDVKGKKVYNQMGTLAKENLEDGRDLPVTTDFRSVFGEVANKHLGLIKSESLFPGWKGDSVGIMKN